MQRGTIRRMYELDRMIRLGKFISAEAAAEELEVSRRTIERDIEELRYSLGAELKYDRASGCYRYDGDAFTLPAQWLTEREIAVLLIAERALRVFTGTSFQHDIHPTFNKLLNPIRHDRKTLRYVQDLCNSVHFHRPYAPLRDVGEEFTVVLDAIMRRRRLSMVYHTSGAETERRREVEPYALINNGGDWYVVGLCRKSKSVKTFSLSEVHDPLAGEECFGIPEDFDVANFVGQGFGRMHEEGRAEVALRITPPAAGWISRSLWHPSQKIKKQSDGEILVTMTCPLTDSLVRWILQMGECVRVEEPMALRKRVVEKARALITGNPDQES